MVATAGAFGCARITFAGAQKERMMRLGVMSRHGRCGGLQMVMGIEAGAWTGWWAVGTYDSRRVRGAAGHTAASLLCDL